MSKFRKKPVVIEATQWWHNGDHPDDFDRDVDREVARTECEGQVVRYFRRPDVPANKLCQNCHRFMQYHGWIDTLEGGHVVCPGDWIITGVKGERYPCKPDIFEQSYEPADRGYAPFSHKSGVKQETETPTPSSSGLSPKDQLGTASSEL